MLHIVTIKHVTWWILPEELPRPDSPQSMYRSISKDGNGNLREMFAKHPHRETFSWGCSLELAVCSSGSGRMSWISEQWRLSFWVSSSETSPFCHYALKTGSCNSKTLMHFNILKKNSYGFPCFCSSFMGGDEKTVYAVKKSAVFNSKCCLLICLLSLSFLFDLPKKMPLNCV